MHVARSARAVFPMDISNRQRKRKKGTIRRILENINFHAATFMVLVTLVAPVLFFSSLKRSAVEKRAQSLRGTTPVTNGVVASLQNSVHSTEEQQFQPPAYSEPVQLRTPHQEAGSPYKAVKGVNQAHHPPLECVRNPLYDQKVDPSQYEFGCDEIKVRPRSN